MAREVDKEILLGFVAEARSYLPAIRHSLARYADDYQRVAEIQAAHRYLHTIGGAAAMVGLAAVEQPARAAEELLEPFALIAHEPLPAELPQQVETHLARLAAELDGLPDADSVAAQPPPEFSLSAPVSDAEPVLTLAADSDLANVDDELLEIFREEAEEHLQAFATHLAQLTTQPDHQTSQKDLRRTAHTLKGAAAMLGLTTLAQLSLRSEKLLDALMDSHTVPDEEHLVLLTAASELLALLARGASPAQMSGELEELHALYDFALSGIASSDGDNSGADYHGLSAPNFVLPDEEPAAEWPEMLASFDFTASDANPYAASAPEEIDPDLLEVFAIEAEEHIQLLGQNIDTLSRHPRNRAALDEIRRSAHTLKGAGALVGLTRLADLAHRMEDLLDRLHAGQGTPDKAICNLLMAATETLDRLTRTPDAPELLAQIAQLQARFAAQMTPADAAPVRPDVVAAALPAPHFGPGPKVAPPVTTVAPVVAIQPDANDNAPNPDDNAADLAATAPASSTSARIIRVPLERLEEIVKLVGELLISRSVSERKLSDLTQQLQELQLSGARLQRVAQHLTTDFETAALKGVSFNQKTAAHAAGHGLGFAAPSAFSLQPTPSQAEFDELEFDRYTEFHRLTRELSETSGDTEAIRQEFGNLLQDFDGLLHSERRLTGELNERLMRLRMVPLGTLAPRLKRAVQVAAPQLGKQAELVINGEDIEIDTLTLDAMADPLLHLLRNAVAHGIESPAVRQARGKAPVGQIRLTAQQEGDEVVLRISDDGGGLDVAAIRAKAAAQGLVPPAELAQMSEKEIQSLIFLPGFSTVATVNQVAGRGVGMDVLHTAVTQLKGVITIDSQPARGTTFLIRLPLTLAVMRALLVRDGSETYALPFSSLVRALIFQPEQCVTEAGRQWLRLGADRYPLVRLGELLNQPVRPLEDNTETPVLLVKSGDDIIALRTEEVIAGRDVVLKSLGEHLGRVPLLLGATLLGDGRVAPVLNPVELVQQGVTTTARTRPALSAPAAVVAERPLTAMIVDDSPSVRRIMTRLMTAQGWQPLPAKDGLDALEILQQAETLPDIVLLDMEMPRMDGYELLTQLRQSAAWQHLPVVMITSRAGEKHRRKALALGASEYLVKPYQNETLCTTIRRLTQKK